MRRARAAIQDGQEGAPRGRSADLERKVTTDSPPTVQDALTAIYASMSEREFQSQVVASLRARGWTVWIVPNMRLTTAGLPDLLCVREGQDVLLALELKREKGGKVSPAQRAALSKLERVSGVTARVVRPSEWPALLAWIDAQPEAQTLEV